MKIGVSCCTFYSAAAAIYLLFTRKRQHRYNVDLYAETRNSRTHALRSIARRRLAPVVYGLYCLATIVLRVSLSANFRCTTLLVMSAGDYCVSFNLICFLRACIYCLSNRRTFINGTISSITDSDSTKR